MLFFSFRKCEPEQKTLEDEKTEFVNVKNTDFKFKVEFKKESNYLKIEMTSTNQNEDFILSFYKGDDTNFNNRIQLSKSISGKSFMYLTKKELGKEFYIKTEFKYEATEYNLTLTQKDDLELLIGEQYSYYVTEEDMQFIIRGTPKIEYNYTNNPSSNGTNKISIWAKGSQDLKTELKLTSLKISPLTKKSLSSYIIELNNEDSINYNFKITGKVGDLIKVGSSLFNKEDLCQTVITDRNMEIFGFLKQDVMEKIYFLTTENFNFIYETITDHERSILQTSPQLLDDKQDIPQNLNIYSFELNTTELFYSFEFKKKEYKSTDPPTLDSHLILLGASYYLYLEKGESLALLPMKTMNDSNFLTLYSNAETGKYNSFILTCENYPFCIEEESKKEKLKEYNSACISYDNNQYGQNSIIQKNQKILLLSCESEKCGIYVNMYTEKDKAIIKPSLVYYKYIRENNEDNLNIDVSQEKKNYYIHIEILSNKSNVEIDSELDEKKINQENLFIYELKSEKQNEKQLFDMKIKAKKNIVYSIIVTSENESFKPQINYLNIYKENDPIKFDPLLGDPNKYSYYIGISPFNFKMNNIEITNEEKKNMLKRDEYYQEFSEFNNEGVFNFNLNKTNENNLLYRMSVFRYMSDFSSDDSIILSYNTSYPFIFTSKVKKMKYMYLYTDNSIGLNISIELIDNIKYNYELFFNDEKNKDGSFDNNNNFINISSEEIGKLKIDNAQPIKMNLILSSEITDGEKLVKLKISEYGKPGENPTPSNNGGGGSQGNQNNDDDDDKKKILLISLPIIGVLAIIVIIVIAFLCKNKSAYDKLNQQINSISFKKDDAMGRDSKEDDLLE